MSEAENWGTPPETPAAAPEPSEATMDAISRTTDGAAEIEGERTEQKKPRIRERYRALYYAYKADGRLFKIGIALVTAVIAACVIVIAGIVSERRLGVVFLRAVVGFFVSGAAMGGALYWLDRFGIPLFIAKHGDQIQMEWLSEAEEPEEELFAAEVLGGVPDEEASQGDEAPAEPASLSEVAEAVPGEASVPDAVADEEARAEIDDTVLDDAFSSSQPEEPSFAPMSADALAHYSAPKD